MPVISRPVTGSISRRPSEPTLILPACPVRMAACAAAVEPYTWDPSHQCEFSLIYAGGRVEPATAGSAGVIGTRIGRSCQVSPAATGMLWVLSHDPFL